jgi:hypothetical protein
MIASGVTSSIAPGYRVTLTSREGGPGHVVRGERQTPALKRRPNPPITSRQETGKWHPLPASALLAIHSANRATRRNTQLNRIRRMSWHWNFIHPTASYKGSKVAIYFSSRRSCGANFNLVIDSAHNVLPSRDHFIECLPGNLR